MQPSDLTIQYAQQNQPWTVPYSDGVKHAMICDVAHIMSSHAVLHASKSVGKLATVFEKMDHGAGIGTSEQQTIKDMSADLLTIALRLANLHGFDLATELLRRVEEKNGVSL